jgi:GT2 family glycosyltransferase
LSNKRKIRGHAPPQPKTRAVVPGSSGFGGVVVANIHPGDGVSPRFMNSMIDLLLLDAHQYGHVAGRLDLTSGANIVTARNKIARRFLEEYPSAEWLWLVDADMTFAPDTLDKLLKSAHRTDRPIMGGLCFALMKGEAQEIVPTLYGLSQGDAMTRWTGFPRDQVVQVVGTGAACLLIHRTVLEGILSLEWDEAFEDKYLAQYGQPSGTPIGSRMFPPPWPWFAETIIGTDWGDSRSEDLTFCLRAAQAGFPVHVDTSVKIGHVKPVVIDEAAYWSNLPAADDEPAPTYVVIPVKGQHDYTSSILRQLSEQGGYERAFVYDNGSDSDPYEGQSSQVTKMSREAIIDRTEVIPAAGLNIHEMWNAGIKRAIAANPRCNIAILNNDIEIGPDFLQRLAAGLRARIDIAAVCGNYDGREFPELVQAVKGVAAGRMDGTGGLAGFAFMVKGEIFAAGCPMFDEDYEIWYGDTDFTRMLDAGQAIYGIVRDATVVHIDGGSKTAGDGKGKRLTPELAEAAERDRKRFEDKWGAA